MIIYLICISILVFKSTPNTKMFKPVIVAFNKPIWYVVSKSDKHNKTIFSILPKSWLKDFYYIWRLDKNSDGLLLLTNVPEIVNEIEHPSKKNLKIYEVEIDKPFKSRLKEKFKKWIRVTEDWKLIEEKNLSKFEWINKDFLKVFDINYSKNKIWKHMLRIVLEYGKKRHIRRMLKSFWYKVIRLTRIKYWKYELWNIKPWKYKIFQLKISNKHRKKMKKI